MTTGAVHRSLHPAPLRRSAGVTVAASAAALALLWLAFIRTTVG